MRPTVLKSALVLVLLGAVACSDAAQPQGPGVVPVVVPVDGVRLTPQTIQVAVGQTQRLTVVVSPLNATDRALTWESSDSSVATVNAAGVVTGRAQGAGVFITAHTHDGGFQSSVNVTVLP